MAIMLTISLMDTTTLRTTLRRKRRINLQNRRTSRHSLIRQELLQLIKRPRTQITTTLSWTIRQQLLAKTDTRQILQNEQRASPILINECLRQPMINISHPTVLSPGNTSQHTLRRPRALSLKLATNPLKRIPLPHHLLTANEMRLPLLIIRCEQKTQTPVDTDHMLHAIGRELLIDMLRHRNMEIPLAVQRDELAGTEFPALIEIFLEIFRDVELNVQAFLFERVKGEAGTVFPLMKL